MDSSRFTENDNKEGWSALFWAFMSFSDEFYAIKYWLCAVNPVINYSVFWEGRIPLKNVSWELDPGMEMILPPELERRREDIWEATKKREPGAYDGKCLVLDELELSGERAFLRTGWVWFSRLLTLKHTGSAVEGYGNLGTQTIIFSLDKRHILYGIRAEDSMYCPLFNGVPGGMLATSDVRGSFEEACMREIEEEAKIDLSPEKYLVAVFREKWHRWGTLMLIECLSTSAPDTEVAISGNREWKDEELYWHPVDRLSDFDPERSQGALLFAKDDWHRKQTTGKGILWT